MRSGSWMTTVSRTRALCRPCRALLKRESPVLRPWWCVKTLRIGSCSRFRCSTHEVFPCFLAARGRCRTLAELRSVAKAGQYPFAHFFNGALISTDAVRKVGNVNRDFFIFGDEVDYFFRLRTFGRVISVLTALHYHPDVTQRPYTPAKIYYYLKNTLILNGLYFNAVWLRHAAAIVAVLSRTASRNGLGTALSLVWARRHPCFIPPSCVG